MRTGTSRTARRTDGERAPKASGGRRIDITVHVEFPASAGPGTRDPLREILARAIIFLMVLAATVVSVALAAGVPGGGVIWTGISRLAGLLSGG
jgi:hypothetical protein